MLWYPSSPNCFEQCINLQQYFLVCDIGYIHKEMSKIISGWNPLFQCYSSCMKHLAVNNIYAKHKQKNTLTHLGLVLHVCTVYPKKYAHGFVVLCFVVVMQSFIMNSHGVFIHIHQGCFAGTGAIVRLPQCQWSKPDGYGKISQCITTTKHSKAKTVCIFLGIYCILLK